MSWIINHIDFITVSSIIQQKFTNKRILYICKRIFHISFCTFYISRNSLIHSGHFKDFLVWCIRAEGKRTWGRDRQLKPCSHATFAFTSKFIIGDWHKSKRRGWVQTQCQTMMCRLMLTQTKKLGVNATKHFDKKSLSRSLFRFQLTKTDRTLFQTTMCCITYCYYKNQRLLLCKESESELQSYFA